MEASTGQAVVTDTDNACMISRRPAGVLYYGTCLLKWFVLGLSDFRVIQQSLETTVGCLGLAMLHFLSTMNSN